MSFLLACFLPFLACAKIALALETPLGTTTVIPSIAPSLSFNPDKVGLLQENTYQVEEGARFALFFGCLGVIAGVALIFLLIVFSCDLLEKRKARMVDSARCIKHIVNYEEKRCGPMRHGETVFDFHYLPSSERPDYIITDEMASVDDATVRRLRHQTLQRRQIEHASRSMLAAERNAMRMSTAAHTSQPPPSGGSTPIPSGRTLSKDGTKDGVRISRPGTPMIGATLTSSGFTSSTVTGGAPLLHHDTAPIGLGLAGRVGFYEDLDNDPDYFGLDDEIDFDLGS